MHVKVSFFIVSAAVVSSFALISAVDQECGGPSQCVGVARKRVDKYTEDCRTYPTIVAYNKCCQRKCSNKPRGKKMKSSRKGNSNVRKSQG